MPARSAAAEPPQARSLVNSARARGLLTQAEADVLWAQDLTAPIMARVLLIRSRGHSLRAALHATAGGAGEEKLRSYLAARAV